LRFEISVLAATTDEAWTSRPGVLVHETNLDIWIALGVRGSARSGVQRDRTSVTSPRPLARLAHTREAASAQPDELLVSSKSRSESLMRSLTSDR
jgi:hypothetical protein